jgi:hypothetical protein
MRQPQPHQIRNMQCTATPPLLQMAQRGFLGNMPQGIAADIAELRCICCSTNPQ